jgi:hypothetical protein
MAASQRPRAACWPHSRPGEMTRGRQPSVQARAFELAFGTRYSTRFSHSAFRALRAGPLPGYLMEAARGLTLTRLTACQALNGRAVGRKRMRSSSRGRAGRAISLRARYAFYQTTVKATRRWLARNSPNFLPRTPRPFLSWSGNFRANEATARAQSAGIRLRLS